MVRIRSLKRYVYKRASFLLLCAFVLLGILYRFPSFVYHEEPVEQRARHEEDINSDMGMHTKFTQNQNPDSSSSGGILQHYKLRKLRPDLHRRSLSQWPNDPQCRQHRVRFAELETLPLCALASFPGSGNTWTRHLLEAASGVFTGSTYRDQQLFMKGYLGELDSWSSMTTFTQKTHECNPGLIKAFNGTGVLLLRNPYRAILSYHNYLFGGHTGFAPISNYRRKDWSAFLHLQTRQWLEMAINWTTQTKALHVLHYELLKEDPITHLSQVLDFYGLPLDSQRLQCLKEHEDKDFKRKEEFVPSSLEIFSLTDREKMDRAVRYVDYLLRKHHHTPLPLHLYEFYNNTSSAQMISVPCLTGETTAVCDARVERLNYARRRPKTGSNKDSITNTMPETEKDSALREAEGGQVKEAGSQTKQDSLERFASTKVGWLMTKMFNSIMRFTWTDPIKDMVKNETILHHLPGQLSDLQYQRLLQDFKNPRRSV